MSMYEMVFGRTPIADKLVQILQAVQPFDPGRYRDAWIERHGDVIVIRVHTRNGGGNRDDQADAIATMVNHPWYLRDSDMEFDDTYADFFFTVDPAWVTDAGGAEAVDLLVQLAIEPVDMAERWQALIEKLGRK